MYTIKVLTDERDVDDVYRKNSFEDVVEFFKSENALGELLKEISYDDSSSQYSVDGLTIEDSEKFVDEFQKVGIGKYLVVNKYFDAEPQYREFKFTYFSFEDKQAIKNELYQIQSNNNIAKDQEIRGFELTF